MTAKATKKTKTGGRSVDWSLRPRGAVGATVQTAAGLVAVAGVGELAQVSPLWGAAGAAVGALGHVVVSAQQQHTPGALLYRLGCWAGAGGWVTWTLTGAGTVWSTNGLAALAVGAIGAGVLAPIARSRPAAAAAAPGTDVVLRSGGAVGLEWERRFKRVCRIAVTVTDVKPWDNGAGYDVHGLLPPGSATRAHIAAACEALATDARLPEGCGCEVRPPRPGGHRGEFILAVSTVNRLGEQVLKHPGDCSPRSILEPVAIGEFRDSSVAAVLLREDSVFLCGRKGGGKTNQLDVFTYGIGRCKDALVWHIDMNGGGMSQPWLHPWLEGETGRPAIDWAASNAEEALLMVTVALAIAKDRKSSYRTFKAQQNAKLLPVSEHLPEIVIMVDEGAEVLSPTNRDPITRQVRDGLHELLRIGRNEAVNVVISSLRPTQDMVAPAVLKQSAVKMALHGLDEPDLGHLYNWHRGISMSDLPTKGCAFLQDPTSTTPRPMKAWFLEPQDIRAAAVTIAGYRPELDAASADVANAEYEIDMGGRKPVTLTSIYADRYERMRAAFTGQAVDLPAVPQQTTPQPAPAAVQSVPDLRVLRGGASAWPDPLPARQAATAPAPAAAASADVPEVLRRALAAFDEAQDDRMHSEVLATALGVADVWALAELFAPFGIKSRPKFKRNGVERRGYYREDIAAAAARIARTG